MSEVVLLKTQVFRYRNRYHKKNLIKISRRVTLSLFSTHIVVESQSLTDPADTSVEDKILLETLKEITQSTGVKKFYKIDFIDSDEPITLEFAVLEDGFEFKKQVDEFIRRKTKNRLDSIRHPVYVDLPQKEKELIDFILRSDDNYRTLYERLKPSFTTERLREKLLVMHPKFIEFRRLLSLESYRRERAVVMHNLKEGDQQNPVIKTRINFNIQDKSNDSHKDRSERQAIIKEGYTAKKQLEDRYPPEKPALSSLPQPQLLEELFMNALPNRQSDNFIDEFMALRFPDTSAQMDAETVNQSNLEQTRTKKYCQPMTIPRRQDTSSITCPPTNSSRPPQTIVPEPSPLLRQATLVVTLFYSLLRELSIHRQTTWQVNAIEKSKLLVFEEMVESQLQAILKIMHEMQQLRNTDNQKLNRLLSKAIENDLKFKRGQFSL